VTSGPRTSPFALYWTSATASYLGDGVRLVAVPLLAATLTDRPSGIALVSAAVGAPWLLFGLFAGVVADRIRRDRLMAWLQVVRGGVGLVLVAGVAGHHVGIATLAALLFLLSVGEVFYDVASHAVLPVIVPESALQRANGRLVTAEVVTFEALGPAIGGLLFAAAAALPFAIDTASFLLSAGLLLVLTRRLAGSVPVREPSTVLADLRAGWTWFVRQPLVRSLTALSAAVNLAAGGFYAVFVLLAEDALGLGSVGYGLLVAASTVGSVAAGVLAGRLDSPVWRRAACLAVPLVALGCLALPALVPVVAVAVAGMIGFGFTVTVFNVVAMTLRQVVTPNEMLGRITAVHRVLCWGALPVGAVLAGLAGDAFGVRAAVGLVVAAGAALAAPAVVVAARVPVTAYSPGAVREIA
jgi:MFS family permease